MTVKTLLLVLLLAVIGPWAYAQVPPPDTGTNAPTQDEVLQRALREAANRDTNAVPNPAPGYEAAPIGPRPPAVARPPGRARPGLPGVPSGNPAAAGASPTPGVPSATPIPTPTATPPESGAGNFAGMAMTPHVSNAQTIPDPDQVFPAKTVDFTAAPLESVLPMYGELVGRNVLRPATLPSATIVLKQTTPLTKLELVQALEAAMALNNVSVVNVGDKFVTVVPTADAWKIPGRINTNLADHIPDMGSVMTHIAQLKYSKPTELVQVLTPFASGTAANPIMPIDSSGILVLRDNVANVKRMLEMIDKVDVAVPSEFVSEVIPIKFAKAEEIASALSSVGGGSGGTVGSRPTGGTGTTSGFNRPGMGSSGYNQPGMIPGQTSSATPTPSGGSAFSQNLQNIIRKAATSGDLQILGTTKIIADIRSNSLLIFATREDMKMIKDIIAKLDVVLAQVLVETIIVDVGLSDSLDLGVSAIQTVRPFSSSAAGAGGMNANTFFDFQNANATNALGQLLGSGIRYFGKVDDDIYVSVEAMARDGKANVIQKPRIQTSHATPASIFIGETVPYISGTYYGYGGGVPSSSYQQLRVGIGVNVTPFINQDGLVVMKIDETINEVGENVEIDGNQVPKTIERTLSAEVAVRDRESIILGGFVRNQEGSSKSGVPLLKDIPLLGYLFRSTNNEKRRTELIVLMRPTVLRTPELAAMQVAIEKERLPGVLAAEKQLDRTELGLEAKRIEDEKKLREQERKDQERREQEQKEAEQKEAARKVKFNEVTPFTPDEANQYGAPATKP